MAVFERFQAFLSKRCEGISPCSKENLKNERSLCRYFFANKGDAKYGRVHVEAVVRCLTGNARKWESSCGFFCYHPGDPDACYVHPETGKLIIECKYLRKSSKDSNSGGCSNNGCDVRNGVLQLAEYMQCYKQQEGVLFVFCGRDIYEEMGNSGMTSRYFEDNQWMIQQGINFVWCLVDEGQKLEVRYGKPSKK